MAVLNLTEARIRELPAGSGIHRDEQVKGLMVICHRSTKTYACQGDVRRNGRHIRTVRVKIDRCDRIGLREARNRAKALMSQIQSGIDPTAGPDESGITLEKALEAHLDERTYSPRTSEGYLYHLSQYLTKFRKRAVTDITRQEVRELYETLKRKHGQTTAGSVMRTLRATINTAMRLDETIGGNPVAALRIPTPKRREVEPIDLKAWWTAVEKLPPARRDLHVALMLTGARRTSMLNVRRDDVDFENSILRFRHMKVGGQMLFPMGPRLAARLHARMAEDEPVASEWLWPSATSACGHIMEPRDEGLPTPHEYRHLVRTMFIACGVPYAESALLLGQKLPGASGGYVHAEHLVEHLRKYAQALEGMILDTTTKG